MPDLKEDTVLHEAARIIAGDRERCQKDEYLNELEKEQK